MPNERNRVSKGDSPKRIHRKRGRVCRCITANTRAICVADTIVRVNRCTPVIVAALIDYWLRTNDHRNNPVIDNNTRRFLFVISYKQKPPRIIIDDAAFHRLPVPRPMGRGGTS